MHIVQISSSELFARCAAELKLEVAITRYVTSLWRTTPDNRVVAGQQLALDYQIKFSDPEKGESTWVFCERLPPDDKGNVRMADAALLALLEERGVRYHFVRRTNSF